MKLTPLSVSIASILSIAVHAADVAGGAVKSGELKLAPRLPVYPPKDSPDAAARNFSKAKIPTGFSADIWASEPLLANPVAFCFDGKGRMFVSETHRYRSSVLDIRHYYWMIEDDLASRNQDEWLDSIKRNFPKDWQQLEKESEIVRLVQDSDGDGKADKSSVYADGFDSALDGIASGVLWHNDALYFANIPALWKLTGAEKAEQGEALHHGYGVRFSYTGHDFHGLIAGPDGRLYFSIGDRGASIKTKEGTTIEVPDEGAVFRCEPDGSRLELVMRGLRNPQELAFDDYGNLFTGDNDSDQGDRERWVLVTEGADAGWRVGYQHHLLGKEYNPWIAEKMWEPRDAAKNQPAYILSPIANLPDGPSGLVHYPGTGLPEEYKGSFFLAGYKGSTAKSQISMFKTEPDGAGFKLVGLKTFMDNVQATDVDFGPDSRFYVSAWDEGWERSDQGRIYRLSHDAARTAQAAQIAEVQKILGEGFKKRTPEELVKLLAHGDQRVRLGAQWELTARFTVLLDSEKLEPLLESTAMTGADGPEKRLSRLHAIWTVSNAVQLMQARPPAGKNKSKIRPSDSTLRLTSDPDAEIRAQSLRAFSERQGTWTEEGIKLLTSKLTDKSPRVRCFAAMALAKNGHADAALAIIQMIRENDGKDLYLQHAGVMALRKLIAREKTAMELCSKAAYDESRAVRLAVLLAWRDHPSVEFFLKDKDPALVREAAIGINDAPVVSSMPALAKRLIIKTEGGQVGPNPTNDEPFLIRALNANFRVGGTDGANSLATYAARAKNEGIRVVALTMLKTWAKPPQRDYITGNFRPMPERPATDAAFQLNLVAADLLGDKSEKIVIAACEALAANDVKTSVTHVLAVLKNDKAAQKVRLAALAVLAKFATPEFETALAVAGGDKNAALKTAASKLMGKRTPDLAATQLIAAWESADASEKADIASALGETKSAKSGEFLAKLVGSLANEPAAAQLEITEAAEKHDNAKLAIAAYEKTLTSPFAKFNVALTGGDKDAGEKLFKEHPVAACLRCHKVNNSGGDAGPDMTGFAVKHDRAYILESIVNVNAKIAQGFQMVILTMKDGSVKAGALKTEENGVLTIQPPGTPAEQVKAADIAKRDTAPSGMIPNLGDLLTKREIRDIVEYVSSLK